MANGAGKAQFDRTVYGNQGNTGNSGGGGGAAVMGSPAAIMSQLRAEGKVPKRNTGRGRRPPARSSRRGR
jgi:hypothetical protein